MNITTINPTTGETVRTFAEHSDGEVEAKLARAAAVFARHDALGFGARAQAMERAAALLEGEKERFIRLMVQEMGKPIRAARAEVDKSAWACRHYAAEAERYLADQPIATEASESYLRYRPLGPVLAIMPWNFPFWQVIRFAAPALMAGNVGLLKHASNVPECALALEELFERAGFLRGVFQALLVGTDRVGQLIADPRIRAVTLTGSDGAGVAVATTAARELKKTVLELGGADPFIVMPSADLELAVRTAVTARLINNGQSCIAAKRFIVHEAIYDRFVHDFVAAFEQVRIGDPLDEATELGPLATASALAGLEAQVQKAVAAGARLLVGGRRVERPGFFYQPTILAEIPRDAAIRREEVFGPVALLFRARELGEAIAIANDSPFGLGSSVWTRDRAEQHRFVDELEAGQTFINAMVVSDPRLPFGGVKRSGWGRELGALGIREFTNCKTIFRQP